jgi:hypothetical protein
MGIYVEILIHGPLDEIWDKTQRPQLHQRWDLRFSEIDYLPRVPGEAQKFTYVTRISAGLRIEGAGESTGDHNAITGERTSALKFWSDDPKSLIQAGSGYWKYIPVSASASAASIDAHAPDASPATQPGEVRFLTWYDYRVRFGALGRLIDSLFFRPLIGWATAWSFDRLRLWIEEGITPETSRYAALIYSLSRLTVAFIWLYHGLVPKLLFHNIDEVAMLRPLGRPDAQLWPLVNLAGAAEIIFAILLVMLWRARWPLWVCMAAMLGLGAGVALTAPAYLTHAFKPLTLNLAIIVLAAVALLARPSIPSAANCLRQPADDSREQR